MPSTCEHQGAGGFDSTSSRMPYDPLALPSSKPQSEHKQNLSYEGARRSPWASSKVACFAKLCGQVPVLLHNPSMITHVHRRTCGYDHSGLFVRSFSNFCDII